MSNTIQLTRGDSMHLDVSVLHENGEEYVMQDGDMLVFTVKKNVYTNEILIQKDITRSSLYLSHDDTKDLKYDTYFYDVQLTFANGDVCTIIKPSKFIITEEINFD